MGTMLNVWDAFRSHLLADTVLLSEIVTWLWSRKPRIFKQNDFPVLLAYMESGENETFYKIPRAKSVDMIAKIHVKIWNESYPLLRQTLTYFDEEIKRALEADLQLDGTAIILKLMGTEFRQLSNYIGESQLTVNIRSAGFDAGSRSI